MPNESQTKNERFTTKDIDFIHWVFGQELVPQEDPYFYYYILVRQLMLESGLEDPRLTE